MVVGYLLFGVVCDVVVFVGVWYVDCVGVFGCV